MGGLIFWEGDQWPPAGRVVSPVRPRVEDLKTPGTFGVRAA